MIRSRHKNSVRGSGHGPVLAYPVPLAPAPELPRKHSRKRKDGFPGFRIRMKDYSRDEVKAAAECTGWDTYRFCYQAIEQAVRYAERELGIRASQMAKLSKRQRAELANNVRLAAWAMWPSYQNTRPFTN